MLSVISLRVVSYTYATYQWNTNFNQELKTALLANEHTYKNNYYN